MGNHAVEQPSTPPVLMTQNTTPLSNVIVRTIVALLATLPNCTFLSYISSCFFLLRITIFIYTQVKRLAFALFFLVFLAKHTPMKGQRIQLQHVCVL